VTSISDMWFIQGERGGWRKKIRRAGDAVTIWCMRGLSLVERQTIKGRSGE
jgi:hypothetical protein